MSPVGAAAADASRDTTLRTSTTHIHATSDKNLILIRAPILDNVSDMFLRMVLFVSRQSYDSATILRHSMRNANLQGIHKYLVSAKGLWCLALYGEASDKKIELPLFPSLSYKKYRSSGNYPQGMDTSLDRYPIPFMRQPQSRAFAAPCLSDILCLIINHLLGKRNIIFNYDGNSFLFLFKQLWPHPTGLASAAAR